ncbi:hypothetical protein LCGC14_1968810 [marine sediment metagenome]|uniref:Uncharacterized protein n=1 Tax=marine sediment metagenome TaxID=412755 RepID=A0A0F9HQU9_9ZZZZ
MTRYRRWQTHRHALLRQNSPEEENRRRLARLRAFDRRNVAMLDDMKRVPVRAAELRMLIAYPELEAARDPAWWPHIPNSWLTP